MLVQIDDINSFRQYFEGVMGRADHHANRVDVICLALAGAVLWKADTIEVRGRGLDSTKNVLKMTVGGQSYALAYNHVVEKIEVREDNERGQAIASFSNETPTAELKAFFEGL